MPSSCCIKGCTNKQNFYGYSMFGFPNDHDTRNLWMKAVGSGCQEPKSHHRVCEVHFEPELIQFIGSRKELKKSAVPSLFCNCSFIILSNPAQKTKNIREQIFITHGATCLDHSYSQNSLALTEHINKQKACIDKQDSVNRSSKHSPNCNLMREPLKNTSKLKGPAGNGGGILNKMLPTMKPAKINAPKLIGPFNHLRKKTRTRQSNLKSQLKNALDENAKLKQELSMLKELMLPVTMLPSNKVKVQLKKTA